MRFINTVIFFISLILAVSCDKEPAIKTQHELAKFFNSKGRYSRFRNSTLIFGDTISLEQRTLIKLDSTWPKYRIYRKAAYIITSDPDSIIYFMYGLSKGDSILKEVRIRSFKKDTLVGDFLIINLDKDQTLSYDYLYSDYYLLDNPELIVKATNSLEETHYSYYELYNGKIVNTTDVPDTVFRRQDLLPTIGHRVRIYDDFNSKALLVGEQRRIVEGKIVNVFRGEDCKMHLLLQLTKDLLGFEYVLTDLGFSSLSRIYGVQNDILVEGKEACLKVSAKPKGEKVLIIEKAYIDNQ